jgi:hypothetical protein
MPEFIKALLVCNCDYFGQKKFWKHSFGVTNANKHVLWCYERYCYFASIFYLSGIKSH